MSPPFGWSPPYDDAYITLTSAQAVWSGAIPAYPGTPVLHGATSPVHLVVVAALLPFLRDPLTALWLSQALASILYVTGLWALGRSLGLPRAGAAFLTVIGLAAGMTPHHLFNGLETGLALGAVTWTLALSARRHALAPAAIATLPFVRPELALLSGSLAIWWFARLPAREWLQPGSLMVAAAAPWLLLLFWSTGTVVPATAAIKGNFLGDPCWPAPEKALALGIALGNWIVVLGPVAFFVAGLARPGLPAACGIAFALALAAYATGLPSHLPRYHHQRYFYTWLPVILLGAGALAANRPRLRRFGLPIVAIVVVVRIPSMWTDHRVWTGAMHAEQRRLTAWLAANVPASEPLMIIDAGYLAFATAHPLIDVVGLKTPRSAELHALLTRPSCGAGRGNALRAIAADSGARYFIPWGEWDRRFGLSRAFGGPGRRARSVRDRPADALDAWWYPVFELQEAIEVTPDPGDESGLTDDQPVALR